jgi:hypothetical protein
MSDPLWEALPLLDLARKMFPALEYLRVRRWFELREKRREAQESLRRSLALSEQTCALHGHPEASAGGMSIALGSPLWCGCNWKVEMLYDYGHGGRRVLCFHRRDPGTGVTLGAVFDGPPDEEQLWQLRKAFSDG